ncbi:MAG: hypothetical protein H6709_00395 [Kofleriaceae bacterium]|nr:hypothetical protein [Kofleriaceae bacterium]
MTRLHSFDDFLAFLDGNQLPHKAAPAQQLVELPSTGPLPGNLFVKWERTVPFLQLIHFMLEVPADRVADVSEALVRLNNLLEVGGFGFDHGSHRLYCRLTVPVFPADGIDAQTLHQLGTGVVRNAIELLDAFQAVVDGKPGADIEDVYKQIAAARKASMAQA